MQPETGANPNARDPDQPRSETPLHWAASSDDADVASALIDGRKEQRPLFACPKERIP